MVEHVYVVMRWISLLDGKTTGCYCEAIFGNITSANKYVRESPNKLGKDDIFYQIIKMDVLE